MTEPNGRVAVAVVGAGMAGRAHAHAYSIVRAAFGPAVPAVDLVLVVDEDQASARELASRYGFRGTANSWQAIAESPDIDAVSVAVPNDRHAAVVGGLILAGKHVLCEKPLAPSAREAWELATLARSSRTVTAMAFNLRRTPAIAAIRRAVKNGILGQPEHFIGRYFTDYGHDPGTPLSWRYQRGRAGGGAIVDVGSHIIDVARFLIGEIEQVQGALAATWIRSRPITRRHTTGRSKAEGSQGSAAVDTDDTCTFIVRFANGALGEFGVSRVSAGFRNSLAFTLIAANGAARFDFERTAEFGFFVSESNVLNGFRRVVVGPEHPYASNTMVMPTAGAGHGLTETFVAQCYEFLRAVSTNEPLEIATFEDGYAVALACEAVQLSASVGTAVSIASVAQAVENAGRAGGT